jgi:hypothetical protein
MFYNHHPIAITTKYQNVIKELMLEALGLSSEEDLRVPACE